jgi:2-oxoglutarate dehydrogenase E2 component (dihydrolipoamide succinyltransferase)
MSTPIINPPQAAVLGLHAIFNRAVPIDGKIEVRPVSQEYMMLKSS